MRKQVSDIYYGREQDLATQILERLHILTTTNHNGQPAYRISEPFCTSLKLALTGGGSHKSFGVPCKTGADDGIDAKALDDYARKQWEAILYYIVGSAGPGGGAQDPISPGTRNLLKLGDLVETKGKVDTITAAGFTFLLQEVNAQVWDLLLIYLKSAEEVCYL